MRAIGQRAGDGHALRLTAGQASRVSVPVVGDAQIVEQLHGPAPRRLGSPAGEVQHDQDVLQAGQERDQVVELEDEADLVQPQPAQVALQPAVVVDHLVIQADAAATRLGDGADHVQERALAGAARAKQPHDLARIDVEADGTQRVDPGRAAAEMLGDLADLDEGAWRNRHSRHRVTPRAPARGRS